MNRDGRTERIGEERFSNGERGKVGYLSQFLFFIYFFADWRLKMKKEYGSPTLVIRMMIQLWWRRFWAQGREFSIMRYRFSSKSLLQFFCYGFSFCHFLCWALNPGPYFFLQNSICLVHGSNFELQQVPISSGFTKMPFFLCVLAVCCVCSQIHSRSIERELTWNHFFCKDYL